ncbi:unnamed protein product [Ostreobium quekettii]|uniref:PCI domain-containing protein n=1 Tax=Ostreobium quekettii TaxID=121088 RepID=A0A8S1J1G2_9CHLO|nr:unnamed protein product [Ostreobium quekettii]|eukprot:evm.model.scf_1503.3 EVM.evm.TU.scf_1503.3   scf_1503:5497-9923(+)
MAKGPASAATKPSAKDADPQPSGAEDAGKEAPTTLDRLRGVVAMIADGVKQKDTRLVMGRVLRETASRRSELTVEILTSFVEETLPAGTDARAVMLDKLAQVQESMQVDSEEQGGAASATHATGVLPEVEMYCYLVVLMFLVSGGHFRLAKQLADVAVAALGLYNRRTLDFIAAKVYFYYSWSYECLDRLASIRSTLLQRLQTAVLQHDEIGQETILNLLLRNYLHYSLYDQAEKLRSKSPEPTRSNNQICRYLYYWGRIRAVQLEYTDARDSLQQAMRKAPIVAHGFRITVSKWLVLVSLLLGEIPEMLEFTQQGMKKALHPYFQLAGSVRSGDLSMFRSVAQQYGEQFQLDKTHNLIVRLHHNVLRIGLRRINLAYSRISLKDVAEKLGLSTDEDLERIVAKAIRDGGVDAIIDHESQCLKSVEVADVYSTSEPQKAFHARVAFCLDVHNEAVKAMRFEPDAHKKLVEDAEARKERLAQEQELAKAMQEEEDDDAF